MVDIRTHREQPESIKENLKKKFQTSLRTLTAVERDESFACLLALNSLEVR